MPNKLSPIGPNAAVIGPAKSSMYIISLIRLKYPFIITPAKRHLLKSDIFDLPIRFLYLTGTSTTLALALML